MTDGASVFCDLEPKADPAMTAASEMVWDFYASAYGPSILGEFGDRGAVARLQDIFVRVATSGVTVEVGAEPHMRLKRSLVNLQLTLAEGPSAKTLSDLGGGRFRWTCSTAQWHRHAALLDAFLKRGPGHQYLTEEGIDDALIEISFGEQHPGMD